MFSAFLVGKISKWWFFKFISLKKKRLVCIFVLRLLWSWTFAERSCFFFISACSRVLCHVCSRTSTRWFSADPGPAPWWDHGLCSWTCGSVETQLSWRTQNNNSVSDGTVGSSRLPWWRFCCFSSVSLRSASEGGLRVLRGSVVRTRAPLHLPDKRPGELLHLLNCSSETTSVTPALCVTRCALKFPHQIFKRVYFKSVFTPGQKMSSRVGNHVNEKRIMWF